MAAPETPHLMNSLEAARRSLIPRRKWRAQSERCDDRADEWVLVAIGGGGARGARVIVPKPAHRRRVPGRGTALVMQRGRRRVGGTPRYERVRAPDARVALPRPTPECSPVPPEQWQTLALAVQAKDRAVRADFVCVPEGCVTTFRCDCCGARRASLSDFRNADARTLERRGRDLMDTLWPTFVRQHASCRPADVEQPTLPVAAQEARTIVEEARRRVKSGQSLPSRLIAFTSRGRTELVLPELPPMSDNDGADHRRAVAEMHYGVRALFRREGVRVDALVMAQLAWGSGDPRVVSGALTPREAPDRIEMFVLTVLTPEIAHMAIAPLRRSSDESVSMDDFTWQALRGPSLLLDGIIAISGRDE